MEANAVNIICVTIKEDMVAEFKEILNFDAEESRKEPGCVTFHFLQDKSAENKFVFYEAFKGDDDVKYHKTLAHYDKWADFKKRGGVLEQNVIGCVGINVA